MMRAREVNILSHLLAHIINHVVPESARQPHTAVQRFGVVVGKRNKHKTQQFLAQHRYHARKSQRSVLNGDLGSCSAPS